MSTARGTRRLAAAISAGIVVLVSACSGGDTGGSSTQTGPSAPTGDTEAAVSPAPATSAPGSTTSSSAPAGDPPTVMSIRIPPGTGSGFVGARPDVELTGCTGGEDSASAAGTVTNLSPETVEYRIYVAFLGNGGVTRGLLQVDVGPVASAASATWSGNLSLNVPNPQCLVRVERTPVDR